MEGEHTIKKALIYDLALALAVSLTACGQSKAEQPTDPTPSTSAPETAPEQTPAAPVETEDTHPPEETGPQEEPKQTEPTEPVEVAEPLADTTPEQPANAAPETPAEKPQEVIPSQPPKTDTESEQSQESAEQQQQTHQPSGDTSQSSEQQAPTINKDSWDQAFYETLTPEQQEVYKNMTNGAYRRQMQQSIEKQRQREAEGWTTQAGDPTEEQLENAWSNIKVG